MKIAILTNYWKESDGDGVKRYVIKLVDALEKKKRVEVKVLFREGKDSERIIESG